MRVSATLLALGAGLVQTVQADRWVVSQVCFFTSCSSRGSWLYNDGRRFDDVDFAEGCRAPFIPGVREACVDWRNSRAHFYEDGGRRRCMRETGSDLEECGEWNTCITSFWDDADCTW
ncbi:hypothetical protein NLU13_0843 [Sarocladium strictum]|uniref:Uncharacterized protein n=1 Tax=Sarocladium strictum TaxID=5046 RepID=A0AA39GPT4_SARSR|nr:hypothetical protein NLU13_0843 [Sarocladium strictum]